MIILDPSVDSLSFFFRDCRRLTRALSEEYNPPSRPIRRTSPGEYLRYKRDQMEKLRNEQLRDPSIRRHRYSFQRCDSDPRLCRRYKEVGSPSRTLTFASPTRNRIKRTSKKKVDTEEVIDKVILPVPSVESMQSVEVEKPRRSALAKNIAERRSRSKERRSSVIWNTDDSTPILQRRASFRCAVCDCDIPFTNCVLCNAEAKAAFAKEDEITDVIVNETDLMSLNSEDLIIDGEKIRKVVELVDDGIQSYSEKKELEDFYDRPTPGINLKLFNILMIKKYILNFGADQIYEQTKLFLLSMKTVNLSYLLETIYYQEAKFLKTPTKWN